MLLGEDLGGRHDRRLPAVLDRLQRGERRDDGLAAADVALQQALHRVRLGEVGAISAWRLLLRARERERQRLRERVGERVPVAAAAARPCARRSR